MNRFQRPREMLRAALIVALAPLAAVACGTTADLEPAPAAQTAADMEAAVTEVEGARVVADVSDWPGDVPISREVQPVRVTIENGSDTPLRLSYDQFTLEGENGRTFGALPPFQVTGEVDRPALARPYPSIVQPDFVFDRSFAVAPYYGDVYPSLGALEDDFHYDPFYFERQYAFWRETELPTPEMLRRALPEGELRAGGEVSGFLYFEELDGEVERVTFRAELVNANNRYRFAVASIPFVTQEGIG